MGPRCDNAVDFPLQYPQLQATALGLCNKFLEEMARQACACIMDACAEQHNLSEQVRASGISVHVLLNLGTPEAVWDRCDVPDSTLGMVAAGSGGSDRNLLPVATSCCPSTAPPPSARLVTRRP